MAVGIGAGVGPSRRGSPCPCTGNRMSRRVFGGRLIVATLTFLGLIHGTCCKPKGPVLSPKVGERPRIEIQPKFKMLWQSALVGATKAPLPNTSHLRRLPLANKVRVQHELLGDLAKILKAARDEDRRSACGEAGGGDDEDGQEGRKKDERYRGVAEGLMILLAQDEAEPLQRQIVRSLALLPPASILLALPVLCSTLRLVSKREMARALEAVGKSCGMASESVRTSLISTVLPNLAASLCEGITEPEEWPPGPSGSTSVLCIQALIALISAPERPPAPLPLDISPLLVSSLFKVVSSPTASRDAITGACLAICAVVSLSASDPASAADGLISLVDTSAPIPNSLLPLLSPWAGIRESMPCPAPWRDAMADAAITCAPRAALGSERGPTLRGAVMNVAGRRMKSQDGHMTVSLLLEIAERVARSAASKAPIGMAEGGEMWKIGMGIVLGQCESTQCSITKSVRSLYDALLAMRGACVDAERGRWRGGGHKRGAGGGIGMKSGREEEEEGEGESVIDVEAEVVQEGDGPRDGGGGREGGEGRLSEGSSVESWTGDFDSSFRKAGFQTDLDIMDMSRERMPGRGRILLLVPIVESIVAAGYGSWLLDVALHGMHARASASLSVSLLRRTLNMLDTTSTPDKTPWWLHQIADALTHGASQNYRGEALDGDDGCRGSEGFRQSLLTSIVPKMLITLLAHLLDSLSACGGAQSGGKIRQQLLGSLACVLREVHSRGDASQRGSEAVQRAEHLCDEASLLPDEEARLAALECLLLGPGPLSSPLPDATRARFSNLLAANMVGSSQSFRRKVVTLFKAGLVKERLSSRHKDLDECIMPALAGSLASSLRNGTSVDRTLTALEIYSAMVDVWLPVLAPHPDPKVMSLPRDEEEEKRSCRILFSEGLATALFRSSLLHPFESVRSAALSLGLRIFPPIKTVDRPIACKCLLVQANVLVSSANPRIADAGSGIVELLYSKYVQDMSWRLTCKEPGYGWCDTYDESPNSYYMRRGDAERHFMRGLLSRLARLVQKGKGDVASVGGSGFAHGWLRCFRKVFERTKWLRPDEPGTQGMYEWRRIIHELVNLVLETVAISVGAMRMGGGGCTDMMDNSPESKVMRGGWLSLRESALMMGAMGAVGGGLLTKGEQELMGSELVHVIFCSVHSGVIEQSCLALQRICARLHSERGEDAKDSPRWLPQRLLRNLLRRLSTGKASPIRRSGQLGHAIVAVLSNEPEDSKGRRSMCDEVFRVAFAVAEGQDPGPIGVGWGEDGEWEEGRRPWRPAEDEMASGPKYDFDILPYGGWLGGLERGRPEYKSPERGEGGVHWTQQMRADESAWGEAHGSTSQRDRLCVLALHVIRHVLSSGGCGEYAATRFGEEATVLVLNAASHQSFVVRNAATLALSSIINRVVAPSGAAAPGVNEVLSEKTSLLDCVLQLLTSGGGEAHLVPPLSLISRLSPGGWSDASAGITRLTDACHGLISHPSWRVRRCAAVALSRLSPHPHPTSLASLLRNLPETARVGVDSTADFSNAQDGVLARIIIAINEKDSVGKDEEEGWDDLAFALAQRIEHLVWDKEESDMGHPMLIAHAIRAAAAIKSGRKTISESASEAVEASLARAFAVLVATDAGNGTHHGVPRSSAVYEAASASTRASLDWGDAGPLRLSLTSGIKEAQQGALSATIEWARARRRQASPMLCAPGASLGDESTQRECASDTDAVPEAYEDDDEELPGVVSRCVIAFVEAGAGHNGGCLTRALEVLIAVQGAPHDGAECLKLGLKAATGGELLTAREAGLLLVGKQMASFNDRSGPEEDEHAWSELVMDIGGLRLQMTGEKSEHAPHSRSHAEGTPFSSRRAAAESIRLSNILGRLHRQRGRGKGSRAVEARAWMATVLLLLDPDAVVRDTAARAVARGLASGLVPGCHDETGLHLVGMGAAAGARDGDDGGSDGCVLGQGAKCLMHEGEEECLQRRDGDPSRAMPHGSQGGLNRGSNPYSCAFKKDIDSQGGLNPYVASQAATRYLMSVFGDEPGVSKFINVAIAASSQWNCPAPPRPFIDIGYGAVPQYVPTPTSPPGKACHHEEEEEDEEGTGEAALLLRLVEDGLQWTLQWGSETEAADVEGVADGREDKSEVLSRVREGLMRSIPSDIMAFSIPLPCS